MRTKIAILCGPRHTYGFSPLPPITDSAPERNVFRIAEHDYGEDFEVHVISACDHRQNKILSGMQVSERYHNLIFHRSGYELLQTKLFKNRVLSALTSRGLKTYDLFTYIYLTRASKLIEKLAPKIVIINSLPQYIRYLDARFPTTKIGLFVRGEMGMSRKYLPRVDFIITNSNGIAKYVSELLMGKSIPIYTIPNSLDLAFCKEPLSCQKPPQLSIIFVGRIIPDKGILELLKAFRRVQEVIPGTALKIIGGNYPNNPLSEYEKTLLMYVEEFGLNVDFIGQVPNNRLAEHYSQAHLAVFPSLCRESFGMVALEAMRCGLPVIASKQPGFEELIVNGETGFLVDDPRNVEELSAKIIKLLSDESLREKMGQAAYHCSLQYTPLKANAQFQTLVVNELKNT